MFNTGQDLAQGRTIALELIRDDHPRHIRQAFEQLAEKPLRRLLIPSALFEDSEDVAVPVDGAPQRVRFAVHGKNDFIQVPLVTRSGAAPAELMGIDLPELPAPIPHRLIGQNDTTFHRKLFDIPIAQVEAKEQPDTVANDLCREPMALVGIQCWWCIHAAGMPHECGAE
jgi:hypothetical protein